MTNYTSHASYNAIMTVNRQLLDGPVVGERPTNVPRIRTLDTVIQVKNRTTLVFPGNPKPVTNGTNTTTTFTTYSITFVKGNFARFPTAQFALPASFANAPVVVTPANVTPTSSDNFTLTCVNQNGGTTTCTRAFTAGFCPLPSIFSSEEEKMGFDPTMLFKPPQ